MSRVRGVRETFQKLNTTRGSVSVREFGVVFFVLAIINLVLVLVQVREHQYISVFGNASSEEALASWGTSDAGSYLGAAISIVETGGVSAAWQWVTNIWSPGMPQLVAFSVSLSGEQFGFIEILGVFGALVVALTVTLLYTVLRLFAERTKALVLIGIFIAQPVYWKYLLVDRIPWSDGYPSVLVVGAICLLALALNSPNIRIQAGWSFLAGTFLAGALYLRSQWLYLPHLLLGLSVLLAARLFVGWAYSKMRTKPFAAKGTQTQLVTSLIAGSVALSLALPYTVWREQKFPDAPSDFGVGYGWTMSSMISAHYNWLYPDQLAGFVTDGGGGTACRVDPQKCEEFHQREAATTSPFNIYDDYGVPYQEFNHATASRALKSPVKWFEYKGPIMWRYWTAPLSNNNLLGQVDTIIAWLALLNIWWFFLLRRRWRVFFNYVSKNTPIVLLCSSVLFFVFVPPYLAHFEARYFLLPRLFVLVPTVTALCHIGSRIWRRAGSAFGSRNAQAVQQDT